MLQVIFSNIIKIKKCAKCGRIKNLFLFNKDHTHKDGRQAYCVECQKEYNKRYFKTPTGIETNVRSNKKYSKTPKGLEWNRRKRAAEKKKYPEKQKARGAVSSAVQSGKLLRKPCQSCGDKNAEAHHTDYSKPMDIEWLCKKHHRKWHKNNKAIHPEINIINQQ